MTACPHCNKELPQDFRGMACPSCHKSIGGPTTRRSLTPLATWQPPGTARPREMTPPPAEDRWDLSDEPAKPVTAPTEVAKVEPAPVIASPAPAEKPSVPRPANVPSSAGVPGQTTRRTVGATMVMGPVATPRAATSSTPAPASTSDEWAIDDVNDDDATVARHVPAVHPKATPVPMPSAPSATDRDASDDTLALAPGVMAPIAPLTYGPSATASTDSEDETTRFAPAAHASSAGRPGVSPRRVASATLVGLPEEAPAPAVSPAPLPNATEPATPEPPAPAERAIVRKPASGPRAAVPRTDGTASQGAGLNITEDSGRVSTVPASSTSRQRPVLASDVLRDDLVPQEPAARVLRIVLAVAGAIVGALGLHSLSDPSQALAWAIPGLTAVLVAAVPFSYGTRALLAFAPAATALLMQSLAIPGTTGPAGIAFFGVAAGLPAALFFRSFFRASRRARAFVAVGLLFAAVWLQLPGGGALFENGPGNWLWMHAAALALIAVSLLSLLAFMGADTTAGCRAWAALAILWAGFVVFARYNALAHGGDLWRAWIAATATAGLTAITALSGAALLSLYARPSEPRTGIGVAASQS